MSEEKQKLPRGVYWRGSILWSSYYGPTPKGTWGKLRESSGGADPRAAARMRAERLHEIHNHRRGVERFKGPQQERRRVSNLLDELERDFETRRIKSLRETKAHIAPIRSFFGGLRAVAVTTARVAAYIAGRRAEKKSDATIDRELQPLRQAYKVAGLSAFAPRIPTLVKVGSNAREGFFERSQFEKVVAELPEVLKDVARFAYATGMRLGAILSLTWAGYDRETKTLRLHPSRSKNDKGVMIPLSEWPMLAAVMERRKVARRLDSPLIFHRDGEPVGEFWHTWQRACERAKVSGRTFHDFRRTAVRNMVRAGIPEQVAMRISGHKTRSMFERYNVVSDRDLVDAMRRRAAYEETLSARK